MKMEPTVDKCDVTIEHDRRGNATDVRINGTHLPGVIAVDVSYEVGKPERVTLVLTPASISYEPQEP